MKKLATLLLAAGLVFSSTAPANAIDFKVSGKWVVNFDYGQGGNYQKNFGKKTGYNGTEDQFNASQRFRVKLEAVASECLSGTLYFEMGTTNWGQAKESGALGADDKAVKLKQAYLDWMVPDTDLKVRMGIMGLSAPSFAQKQSMAFSDDVAGITVSYAFNDNVAATVFWARPYNDNYTGNADGKYANYMDNMDVFGLMVPLKFDGFKITPFGMVAAIGPNTFKDDEGNNFGNILGATKKYVQSGLLPAFGATGRANNAKQKLTEYGTAWWAGVTADVTAADPFHFALDFTYGSVQYDDSHLNRAGWLVAGVAEYKMDWGTPGLIAWYGSGDDDDAKNGSERLPCYINAGSNDFSTYAFFGKTEIGREAVLARNLAGLWGVGLRIKDMSFIENLKHTFRATYMGGTNSQDLIKDLAYKKGFTMSKSGFGDYGVGTEAAYLTNKDSAVEIGLRNEYKMYQNLNIVLDLNYLFMNYASSTKKAMKTMGYMDKGSSMSDSWNIKLCFEYVF